MERWEYLVVYIQGREHNSDADNKGVDVHANADKFTETLNKYAGGGWELMNFEWDGDRGAKAIFKRPRG